jgi:hypothetical protein
MRGGNEAVAIRSRREVVIVKMWYVPDVDWKNIKSGRYLFLLEPQIQGTAQRARIEPVEEERRKEKKKEKKVRSPKERKVKVRKERKKGRRRNEKNRNIRRVYEVKMKPVQSQVQNS